MTTTLLIVILRTTPQGVCEVPLSAWEPIRQLVEGKFQGHLKLHDHDAGAHHDFPDIPVPYYALEMTVEDARKAQLLDALHPLITSRDP